RGLVVGLPRAPLVPGRRRTGRLPRRQRAQVAVHADGLLPALDSSAGRPAAGVLARARVSPHERRGRQPLGLRTGTRPPVPLTEALGGAPLLRPRGDSGADPRGRSPRRADRALDPGRAGLGALRAAPAFGRLLPPRGDRRGERGATRAGGRERRGL